MLLTVECSWQADYDHAE